MTSERTDPPPIRGRGAAENPRSRFETLEYLPADEARTADDPGPETRFYADASRSIIAHNESPDVGFDYSVNPYRGCEHGCVYCLDGDTPILMADGSTKPLREVVVGDAIYGTRRVGWYRRLAKTDVLAHWSTREPAYRITLADGTVLVASAHHRFLTERGWKFVTGAQQGHGRRPHLTPNDKLMGTGGFAGPPARTTDYHGVLRIVNADAAIVGRIEVALRELRFAFVHDRERRSANAVVRTVRLRGGLREHLRFFHEIDPAITRKRQIEGTAIKSDADLRVAEIEPLREERPLYDITTGTGDFIANGVVSHNCYARPTHEYLGFSAGLDFETRILVKRDAPALLRAELMKPGWTPRVIALSGVTDPYQPVERRLRLTRGCLEVLADFRNPVMIVTKNHLVTRDADLLAALAEHDAAVVNVSVTTLDNGLQRVMEPRTAVPARRLAAIEALAEAGVPVRVLVAPVIPGLTEHELPAIVRAAADAGARSASYIVLRLPHGVGDLFERWLERHFPDRKNKVMNRIRELRGGRTNETRFHKRMRGEGIFAEQMRGLFRTACRQAGLEPGAIPPLSTAAFRRPGEARQLGLFDRGVEAAPDPGGGE